MPESDLAARGKKQSRILLVILAAALNLSAQPATSDQFARIFEAYNHSATPGCAAGVSLPEQPVWTKAYGMADLEHAIPNTPDTVFEAGSVAKQFTAAAVLLLVERGSISLTDDIRKYFPEIPAYQRVVTVRNLLEHTSGLRDWGAIESIAGWPRGTREYTQANVLDILSHQKALNYLPGDQWSYTNSGYNLAAMLVERVSGMTFDAFCRKELFEPLGMTATQWRDDFRKVVANRAIAYGKKGTAWRQDMPFEDAYGNGGLLTTVSDLLRWNHNMDSGSFHASVFRQMIQPASLTDGHPVAYGMGLFLEKTHGLPEISHSGATAGYRAWLGRIPSKGISIAILCNAASADTGSMANQIIDSVLGADSAPRPVLPANLKLGLYHNLRDHATIDVTRQGDKILFDGYPAEIPFRFDGTRILTLDPVYGDDAWEPVEHWTPDSAELSQYPGVYSSDEADVVLQVTRDGDRLVIHRRPKDEFVLSATYRDAFFCSLGRIRFLRDEHGKVEGMRVSAAGVWDLRFKRAN